MSETRFIAYESRLRMKITSMAREFRNYYVGYSKNYEDRSILLPYERRIEVSERRKNDPYRVHCRFNFYYLRYMRTNDFRLKRIFISGNFTRVLRFIANVLLSNILWLLICIPRFQSVPISYIVGILFRISDLFKKWNSKERQN